MTFPTYEQYDENEYFINFKLVHPILIYAKDAYNLKKKEYQLKLLNRLNNNEITFEQLKETYSELVAKEIEKSIYIEHLKEYYENSIKNENNILEYSILQYINNIL